MIPRKVTVLCSIILAVVLTGFGVWLFKDTMFGSDDIIYGDNVKEACVIETLDNNALLVYIDSTLYIVPTQEAIFSSVDESVKSVNDIKGGTIIWFVSSASITDANFPSSYNDVSRIVVRDRVDNEAYEAGSKLWQDWLNYSNSFVEKG